MRYKYVSTADGSKTLYVPNLDETYHSQHGAVQESFHVYIKSGIEYLMKEGEKDLLKIFEMGFGTGLNAYLTARYALAHRQKVFYSSIEKYPLGINDYGELGYFDLMNERMYRHDSITIANAPWNQQTIINDYFEIEKLKDDFLKFEPVKNTFDLIYYDAFGHRAQSELWELKPFQTCYQLLRKDGLLVTYASKGSARRNLVEAGFKVEKIPGPPGKREMMRAKKV